MKPLVIDTNVPIVANGPRNKRKDAAPSEQCQEAAILRLKQAVHSELILLDSDSAIQNEYRRYLDPKGQPGVGDLFYRHILNSMPGRVERRELPKDANGEYTHLPQSLIDAGFDQSDRKFAALAKQENGTVINATDSDWLEHARTLSQENIEVSNICGCDAETWFES